MKLSDWTKFTTLVEVQLFFVSHASGKAACNHSVDVDQLVEDILLKMALQHSASSHPLLYDYRASLSQ